MKKSILILCACAALAGCSDDDLVVKRPAIPGSEVQFGATAYMSNGNSTRTDYGDVVGNQIELRWVVGDKIDIACPQAAAGRRMAAYEIKDSTIVKDNPDAAGKGTATKLQKLGEYGIQWGEPGPHTFYALYPSSESFTDSERANIGIDKDGVNGYLPVNQDPKKVTQVGNNYILEPDMRYAFMVAKKPVNSAAEGFNGVSLSFEPLVTALQFELTAPTITNNTTESTELTITAVSLHTVNEQNICGKFQYKFEGDAIIDNNGETTGFSRITQTIPDSNPVKLNAGTGNKMDVTFFVLPAANIADGNLRLQVFYNYKGSPYVKTLLIGKDLEARKKYYFRNVQLPQIDAKVQGSSWFSALDPNVYISQLSIPVAGNTFSNYYSGDNKQYYQEQTLDYTELWNKGVRGFEFVTAHGKANFDNSTSGTLEDNRFVCNGQAMQATKDGTETGTQVTFGNAFRELAGQLTVPGFQNECLIVICTYRTYGESGVNPQQYITDLNAFLGASENKSLIADKLVRLTPQSTVENLRGKIAIIVRLMDDQFSKYKNVPTAGDIDFTDISYSDKLTIVNDWGTSVDKWDKRFGTTYMTEGAYATSGKTNVEDKLWGVSSSNSDWTLVSGYDFKSDYPSADNFQYKHSTNVTGENVYVQDFYRIVKTYNNASTGDSFTSDVKFSANQHGYFKDAITVEHNCNDYFLWLKWPESYTQKQNMIKGLVEKSMATIGTVGDGIYINSLCGYYPTLKLGDSFYPYNDKYYTSLQHRYGGIRYNVYFKLGDAGAGGDYVTCAYDLNKWFYQYLTVDNKDKNGLLKQGPVGLVMLNHIGTTNGGSDDKSLDLVNWIMMNNFKFPLSTAKTNGNTQGTGTGGGTTAKPGGGAS